MTERRFNPTYLSGVAGGAWVALAFFRPELTFHVAPVLVGGLFPIGHRLRVGRPLTAQQATATFVGGMLNVAIATGLLAWFDKLRGPSLLPFGGAAVEALVLGAAAAAIVAVAVAARVRLPSDHAR